MAALDVTGSFISISENDKTSSKSSIQQLVDIVQSDIASINSTTRKSYEVFVSGGVDLHPITSSLFQTVYDQDFTLGTSNALFDITIGSLEEVSVSSGTESYSVNGVTATVDAGGKLTFSNNLAMMREKVNIYKQFASILLGDSNAKFVSPHFETPPAVSTNPATEPKYIKAAVFICFKRLFTRDNIFKQSFAMKLHKKASLLFQDFVNFDDADNRLTGLSLSNIDVQADLNSVDNNSPDIYDDRIVATKLYIDPVAGEVSTLMNSSDEPVGVIFYDKGVIVLDAERAFDGDQTIRGLIDSTRVNGASDDTVRTGPFYVYGTVDGTGAVSPSNPKTGYFYPVYTSSTGSNTTELTDSSSFTLKDKDDVVVPLGSTQLFLDSATASIGVDAKPAASENYPLFVPSVSDDYYSNSLINEFNAGDGQTLLSDSLYPGLWVSGTIDNILDHICTTRFGRGNFSAISFRNETVINSSLIFCRAAPTQFNYSTNSTYTDSDGNIISPNFIENNSPFSYVTTVGLYDANRNLLAVAKTSRPIEKNPDTDLSIRVRLDY